MELQPTSYTGIKEIFRNLRLMNEYFFHFGNMYEIKCNSFYTLSKYESFCSCIELLTECEIIKPIPHDEISIYLYKFHELQPQFVISKKFILTAKGKDLLEILPEE